MENDVAGNMEGLFLNLQKERFEPGVQGGSDYTLWGYYDELSIKVINNWHEFMPEHAYTPDGEENTSEMQLKLIRPNEEEDSDEEIRGYFDYGFTKEDGEKVPGPFIVVVMLHFSSVAIQAALADGNSYGLLNKLLQGHIRECLNEIGGVNNFRELHCATYYTAGFSDMVIIFRTSRLDRVTDLTHALRCRTIVPPCGAQESSVIFTTYAVCGLDKNYVPNDNDGLEGQLKDIRMSIRFLLNPGVSAQWLYKLMKKYFKERYFKDDADGLLDKYFPPISGGGGQGNFLSHTYGSSDVLMIPDFMPYYFIKEFTNSGGTKPEGFFSAGGGYMGKYILAIRTSIRKIPSESLEFDTVAAESRVTEQFERQKEHKKESVQKIEDVRKVLDAYYNKVNKKYENSVYPRTENYKRYVNGLLRNLYIYWDLTRHDHARDVRAMLEPLVMDSLKANIELATNEFENLTKLPDLNEDELLVFTKMFDENIDSFRFELNKLLLDLTRSDRQYVEGRVLLHSSIGSATKLMLAYGRILRHITKWLHDDKDHAPDSVYSFLFSSGGVSETKSKLYFKFMEPEIDEEKDLIKENRIIQMKIPEQMLFMPGITVYSITHECLHYVGNRNYKARAKSVMKAVYTYVARFMSGWYDYSWTPLKSDVFAQTFPNDVIENEIIKDFKNLMDAKREKFFNALKKAFISNANDIEFKPAERFASKLPKAMFDIVYKDFLVRYCCRGETSEKSLPVFLYRQYQSDVADTWEYLRKKYGNCQPFVRLAAIYEQAERSVDRVSESIKMYFDRLLGNNFNECEVNTANTVEPQTRESFDNKTLYEIIQLYTDITREIFVDTVTCCFLECDSAVFLTVFLYGIETPLLKLPSASTEVVFRFGCILTLIDKEIRECMDMDVESEFENSLRDIIRGIGEKLIRFIVNYEHGNKSERDGEVGFKKTQEEYIAAYTTRIFEILKKFRKDFYKTEISKPIIEYVEECVKGYEEKKETIRSEETNKLNYKRIRELVAGDIIYDENYSPAYDSKKWDAWKVLLYFWESSFGEEVGGKND